MHPHKIEGRIASNLEAAAVWSLISGEPEQAFISTSLPFKKFKDTLTADQQRARKRGHIRLLNCGLYTLDDDPGGYVMFNPAFDGDGRYGFYMEDIFVEKNAREHGIGSVIIRSLANKALNEGAKFIKWETDKRNTRMMEWTENNFGAARINEVNLDATPLLSSELSLPSGAENAYITRPITLYDAGAIRNLGITTNEAAVKSEGGLPLVGFLTWEKEEARAAVAVTFATLNYSTFNTSWGINLEQMNHRSHLTDEQLFQVVASTIKAVRRYEIPEGEFPAKKSSELDTQIRHLRWHSNPENRAHAVLTDQFNLSVRTMSEAIPPSTMVLYLMNQDAVQKTGLQYQPK